MKLKNKLLSILAPAFIAGSMTAFIIPMSSCTTSNNSTKKEEEKKQGTSQIKMSRVSHLKDINATDAPFCVLNTDTTRSGSVQINIPDSEMTSAVLNYQKGTFDPETSTITWDETWTSITPTTATQTVTIDHIDYLQPVRFYAYNTTKPGQFSVAASWENNFNFRFYTKSNPACGKGIRIGGSAKSLLATGPISGESITTLDDLNENSQGVFNSLFLYEEPPVANANNFICEVNPGFLPFKTMKNACYKNMFAFNQNLLAAPDLPSKSLAMECYYGMFQNCAALQNAPYLPATILVGDCYSYIFKNCQVLMSVSLAYPGTLLETYFKNWLEGAGGHKESQPTIFYDGFDTTYSTARKTREDSSIIPSNFKIVSKATTDPTWLNANTTVFEFKDDSTFGTPTVDITDYYPSKIRVYNTDPVSVVAAQKPEVTYTPDPGKTKDLGVYKKNASNQSEKIDMEGKASEIAKTTLPSTMYLRYIKEQDVEDANCLNVVAQENNTTIVLNKKASGATGLKRFDKNSNGWVNFETTDAITLEKGDILKVYGDIATTGSRGGKDEQVFTVTDYTNLKITGKAILKGNIMSLLSDTKDVPATAFPRDFCFARLFEGSTGIVGIDSSFMPATSVALRKGCFYEMFKDCTALTTPPTLGWTTLADSCYCEMFSGCKALQTCPALLATTATDYCYQAMFKGCEALTTPVDIRFAQMKYFCCESMYMGCKNLTRPAIFNNGNQITEDESETYRGYSLNNTFRDCSKIKVCTDAQKSQVSNPKIFFWCWDYNPGTGWGTGPEGTFRGTNGKYKYPTGGGGGPGGGQPVDPQSGIANTKYYYYS